MCVFHPDDARVFTRCVAPVRARIASVRQTVYYYCHRACDTRLVVHTSQKRLVYLSSAPTFVLALPCSLAFTLINWARSDRGSISSSNTFLLLFFLYYPSQMGSLNQLSVRQMSDITCVCVCAVVLCLHARMIRFPQRVLGRENPKQYASERKIKAHTHTYTQAVTEMKINICNSAPQTTTPTRRQVWQQALPPATNNQTHFAQTAFAFARAISNQPNCSRCVFRNGSFR